MLSLTHLLLLGLILLVIFGPSRLPNLARSIGESARAFKKGLKGEGDIDVTDSVKRLDDRDEPDKRNNS
jgi:sec-independent protein translocase protein TatA